MHSIKHSIVGIFSAAISAAVAFFVFTVAPVHADTYVLTNDGQVSGELVNRDEKPRLKFVIRRADGTTITVDRSQIKQIVPQPAAEAEYEKIRPTFADTAADQWKLAQWCLEHKLQHARQTAQERVIELDPDHKLARSALGYSQFEGRWVQSDQLKKEAGYVYYKGRWLLPQEIEVLEQRRANETSERQWFTNLRRLRNWLKDPAKAEQAREELQQINDRSAINALTQALENEPDRQPRIWYVAALGRLGAVKPLVDHALDDDDEEIRLSCIEQLTGKLAGAAVPMVVPALKSKDNVRVNRAGLILGKLGDKSALPALMDALVTTHRFMVVEGSGNPNSMNAGFSPTGGGGMTMGAAPPRYFKRDMENQQVLDAVVAMCGGSVNYGFDPRAWKSWYASQHAPATIDARRD